MYKIYKLTKPSTPNIIYIGCTSYKYLSERIGQHRSEQKLKPHIPLYQWLDKTCKIELVETTDDKSREYEVIQEYLNNPEYILLNERIGKDTRQIRKNNVGKIRGKYKVKK